MQSLNLYILFTIIIDKSVCINDLSAEGTCSLLKQGCAMVVLIRGMMYWDIINFPYNNGDNLPAHKV